MGTNSLFAILEQVRVRRHFRTVVAELRASDISELTTAQRAARAALIDELERYGKRGLFPKNTHTREAMAPTFIDEDGTRCAMAHLFEMTGDGALAARVARMRNSARVRELAADTQMAAALSAWLSRAGFSVAEAARIQPSYCHGTKAECVCAATHTTGVLEGVVLRVEVMPDTIITTLHVDAVHGDVGGVAVNSELTLTSAPYSSVGDALLIPVFDQPVNTFDTVMRIAADGTVSVQCAWGQAIPSLQAEHAIEAMLVGAGDADRREQCEAFLESIEPAWGWGRCDTQAPDRGCSVGTGDAGTVLVGATLMAALRARRLRRRIEVAGGVGDA